MPPAEIVLFHALGGPLSSESDVALVDTGFRFLTRGDVIFQDF